jgi:hypothetical protein
MGRELLSPVPADQAKSVSFLDRRVSRRTLLGTTATVGIVAGGNALASALGVRTREQPFQLPERPHQQMIDGVVMIDFAPETVDESYPYFNQGIYTSNEVLLEKVGSNYYPEWQRNLLFIAQGLLGKNQKEELIEHNPQMAMAMGAVMQFEDHGKIVVETMRRTLWHIGNPDPEHPTNNYYSIVPEIIPIQLGFKELRFEQDQHGNERMYPRLDVDTLIYYLQYSDQPIVNLSWQLGKTDVALLRHQKDGGGVTTEFRLHGAYTKDRAVDSLRDLFKLCEAFPEKMFVAACGNYGDDIREARTILNEEWPTENLILTAQATRTENGVRPTHQVQGADLYIVTQGDGQMEDFWGGSTISTGMTSGILAYFHHVGINPLEGRKILLSTCTDETSYETSIVAGNQALTTEGRLRLFSPAKLRSFVRQYTSHYPES